LLGGSIQRLAAVADSVEVVVAGGALAPPPAAHRGGPAGPGRVAPPRPPVADGVAPAPTRDPTVGRFSPPEDENRPIGPVTSLCRHRDAGPQPAFRTHGDAELAPGLRDHAVNVLAGGVPAWLQPALRHAL